MSPSKNASVRRRRARRAFPGGERSDPDTTEETGVLRGAQNQALYGRQDELRTWQSEVRRCFVTVALHAEMPVHRTKNSNGVINNPAENPNFSRSSLRSEDMFRCTVKTAASGSQSVT